MSYEPQINDYVIWDEYVRGWIYFKGVEYVTIEMNVKPKSTENYQAAPIHANDRLLVLCYRNQWKELKYVKSRESIYEEQESNVEIVGEGTGPESIKK